MVSSDVVSNPSTLAPPGGTWEYIWSCDHEGVFPFHDGGNYSSDENRTNVYGWFGAVVVEPPGTTWRASIISIASKGPDGSGGFEEL